MTEPSRLPLRRQVLRGLMWSAVRNWGARLISFAIFIVVARHIDARDMGLVAAALAVIAFAELFAEQGIGSAIVQRKSVSPSLLNAAFALNLGIAIAASLALMVLAPAIARTMGLPDLTDLLRVLTLSIVFAALGFCQQAMYMRHFEYRWLAVRTLIATAVSGAAAVALVIRGYGAWGLVAQAVLMTALNSALLWWRPQWRPSFTFDLVALRSLLGYGASIFGSLLLGYGNTHFVELFLAATLGPAALGIYAVGMRVYSTLMQALSATVLEVAHSGFSRLAEDRPRLLATYHDATLASAVLAAPVFCLTGLVAPEIAIIVFGSGWLEAASVMAPMALLGAVQSIQFYNGSVLNAIGKPSLTLLINLAKVVATVTSLFASRGQPLAVVVWSFVLGQLCVSPLSYAMARRGFGLSLWETARRLAPFVLGYALMVTIVYGLRALPAFAAWPALPRLLGLSLAALSGYAILCIVFARQAIFASLARLRR